MIGLIQRVSEAATRVDSRVVGEIGPDLLALVCVERRDTAVKTDRLLEKLLNYRVFSDAQGKTNLPVRNIDGNGQAGGLLVVSWFMLVVDTKPGIQPSFMPVVAPEDGRRLYEHLIVRVRAQHPIVATGGFGADMKVSLANDGPVTFRLQIAPQVAASVAKTAASEVAKSV